MLTAIAGLVILSLSTLGGWLLVRRHGTELPTQVKAIFFGLYFWGLVFLQLIVAAIVYSL